MDNRAVADFVRGLRRLLVEAFDKIRRHHGRGEVACLAVDSDAANWGCINLSESAPTAAMELAVSTADNSGAVF